MIFYPGQFDHDCSSLPGDFGLGHTEGVDPSTHDRNGLIEDIALDGVLRLQDKRHAALQIKPESGFVAARKGSDERQHRNGDGAKKRNQ